MISISNLEELIFEPQLTEEQIEEIESWDFSEYDFHSPIDNIDNLKGIIEENIKIEFTHAEGEPKYWINEEQLENIKSNIQNELTENGSIGDLVYELLQKYSCIQNVDTIYEESFQCSISWDN